MTTLHQYARNISTALSSVIAVLGFGGGAYGLVDPITFSTTIGIPIASTSSPAVPFICFIAARNLGSGLSLLVFNSTGQRKAAGMSMMCGVAVAFVDAWICANFDALEGKAAAHAIMGVFMGVVGGVLYLT